MKKMIFFSFLIFMYHPVYLQNNIIQGIVTLQNSGSKPAKGVQISSSGANTVYTDDSGQFELIFQKEKSGKKVTLSVYKEGYQVVGINPTIVEWVIPTNPSEKLLFTIVNSDEHMNSFNRFVKIIEKRLNKQTELIQSLNISLQNNDLNENERKALTQQITNLSKQVEELEKDKRLLAERLATTNIDNASDFVQEAFRKFEQEGDVRAALMLMPEQKIDEFSANVSNSDRRTSIKNYIIRARLLAIDMQFQDALRNYRKAIEQDSVNVDNLGEIAGLYNQLNDYKSAIEYYHRAISHVDNQLQKARLLNNLCVALTGSKNFSEVQIYLLVILEIFELLEKEHPGAYLSDEASTHEQMALIAYNTQDTIKAEQHFKSALRIYYQLEGKDSIQSNLARISYNLGLIYHNRLNFGEAEEYYTKSLEIYRRLIRDGSDNFLANIVRVINNLNLIYNETQEIAKIEASYKEKLHFCKMLVVTKPQSYELDLFQTGVNLAIFYQEQLNSTKQEEYRKKGIEIIEEFDKKLHEFPNEHPISKKYSDSVERLKIFFNTFNKK